MRPFNGQGQVSQMGRIHRDNAKLDSQALAMHAEGCGNALGIVDLVLDGGQMQHRAPRSRDFCNRRGNDRIDVTRAHPAPLNCNLPAVAGGLRASAGHVHINFRDGLLRHALCRVDAEAYGAFRFIDINNAAIAHAARNLMAEAQDFQGLSLGPAWHFVLGGQAFSDEAGNL